jgi:hypothetical protein
MKSINYRWWKISLTLIIMLAPSQQLNAAVKQFTDDKGIIHINNIVKDKTKSQNEDHDAAVQHKGIEVKVSTPLNIFPEPEGTNSLASNPNFQAQASE